MQVRFQMLLRWSILAIMTIKKDGTICVLKVWIRNVKKWKLELIYVFAHKMCGYGQFLWACNWPWCCMGSMSPALYLQVSGWSFYKWWKTSVMDLSIFKALMWHIDNSSLLKLLILSCCDKGLYHISHIITITFYLECLFWNTFVLNFFSKVLN